MYINVVLLIAAVSSVYAASFHNEVRIEMPKTCDFNYCFDKSPDYPQKLIDDAINKSLGDNIEIGDHIQQRYGIEKPEDDCGRETRFDPIYQIRDIHGTVRFVAQSDKLLQKIRTERCIKTGRIEKSRYLDYNQLLPYNFTCQQKTIDYSFLTLSLYGTRLEDVDILGGLPVCCSCHLEKYQQG